MLTLKYYSRLILISVSIVYSLNSFSQGIIYSYGLYNLTNFSGEIKAGGIYGLLHANTYGISNDSKTANYFGGVFLKTSSYIWSPNFLTLDVDGGYFPESLQNQNLIFPNHYDIINTRKLHIGSTLFAGKPITVSGFINFINSYDSRDNFVDIQTIGQSYGGNMSIKMRAFPINISVNQNNWNSREIETGNTFENRQNYISFRTNKTFGKKNRNKNELSYTHNDNWRKEYSSASYRSIIDNLELNDSYNFDSSGLRRINSRIYATNQTGVDSFKQLAINENLFYKLPHHFDFNANYSFTDALRPALNMTQQIVSGSLSHQLFQSLRSSILEGYTNSNASAYQSTTNNTGLNLSYSKKIIFNGIFGLSYGITRSHQEMNSSDAILPVLNEPYVLSDNTVTLLKRPYIIESSIVVKDVTGTVIYTLNIDYILTMNNGYLELRRIPGGQIANNATVYLFYNANQPGSYKYNSYQSNYSANLTLFKSLFNMYGNVSEIKYSDLVNSLNLNLDYLKTAVCGARMEYKILNFGTEWLDYESSVFPYKMIRYFINIHGIIRQRTTYTISSNYNQNYDLPNNEPDRIYKNLNGMFSYGLSRRSKFDVSLMYQNQTGRGINMDLFMTKFKLTTSYRGLDFIFGFDVYDRSYLNYDKETYVGGSFLIVKKF